ncbi:uncharacterized protein LOC123676433 [Harmonia axyridis]|uniref:uncharacterized protein LOC123676433 n=1 Tax=Harmonia axyridis TaxID=115357 RepID=UPI001E2758E5|nr:uncharacterized protein LOC123676433 [Harmonia axyridis]
MYQLVTQSIVVHIVLLRYTFTYERGCSIATSDLDNKQPLILNNYFNIFLPDNGKEIHIPKNETLIISCIEKNNYQLGSIKSPFVNITCFKDGTFLLGKNKVTFKDLLCKEYPKPTARVTKKKCGKSLQEIEVGFKIAEQFVQIFDVCFDSYLKTVFYSHFRLTKWINDRQNVARVNWRDDFYNKDGAAYTKKNQQKYLNTLLELPIDSEKIVKDNHLDFLSRGHLSAKADFYYAHQQSSTFFLINAAPQWQAFNNGNWKTLEIAVRNLAAARKLDLEIYTGTHEVLEMTTFKTKSKVEIYLHDNGLPVPLFFWKIVFDPKTETGVAFIGVNNPYITENELEDVKICRSISDRIKWVRFMEKRLDKGYSYACRLKDFVKVVKYLPPLRVAGVLE